MAKSEEGARRGWKWFGRSGHFICGSWCRFHLCTQVGKYLVSTVGEYVHPRHSQGNENTEAEWLRKNWPGEDIGFGRKYETMVFRAGKPCERKECNCGQPDIDGHELDVLTANLAGDARDNHIKLCRKWSKKR